MSAFEQARHCAVVKLHFGPTRWKRSDIDDLTVLLAYHEVGVRSDADRPVHEFRFEWADGFIAKHTGAPLKVVRAAIERAVDRGLIDYGVSVRGGWPTETGEKILADFFAQQTNVEMIIDSMTRQANAATRAFFGAAQDSKPL